MTEHRPAKAEAAINSGLHSPKFGASFCVTVFPVSHAANEPQVMCAGRSHEIHRTCCLDPSVAIGLPSASSKEFRCVSDYAYHQHAKEVAPRQSEQDTCLTPHCPGIPVTPTTQAKLILMFNDVEPLPPSRRLS